MGAISRKTSDRQIAGSTLIVTGQQILTVKRFPNTFQYKYRPFRGGESIPPVTTTTTTQLIASCDILTQDYDYITTQDNYILIWC